MKCKVIQKKILSDYVDKEMPQEMLEQVKKHLDGCGHCRDLYQEVVEKTIVPFRAAPPLISPETLWSKIEQRLDQEIEEVEVPAREQDPWSGLEMFLGFLKETPGVVPVLVSMVLFISLFSLKSNLNRFLMAGAELKNEKEFHYIFSRTRVDLREDEKGFGTSIEEFFL